MFTNGGQLEAVREPKVAFQWKDLAPNVNCTVQNYMLFHGHIGIILTVPLRSIQVICWAVFHL